MHKNTHWRWRFRLRADRRFAGVLLFLLAGQALRGLMSGPRPRGAVVAGACKKTHAPLIWLWLYRLA